MPNGINRYECRMCPYQWILTREIYELTTIKRKEVEDVLGGKGSWDNVDQMPGMSLLLGKFVVWCNCVDLGLVR